MTDKRETDEVTVCATCVFYDEGQYCTRNRLGIAFPWDPPPDWCPLRKGPVLVTLKLRS